MLFNSTVECFFILIAAVAAAAGYPPRPPMLRPGDPSGPPLPPGYPPQSPHAAALLGRPYEELAHVSAALKTQLRI